jgi:hypothetical protein
VLEVAGVAMKLGRRAKILLALLAALAAVALYVGVGRRAAGHPPLPEYAVARFELAPGRDAPFEIDATPAASVATKLVAFAFALGAPGDPEGEPNPVDAKVEFAPGGALRVTGRGRTLQGAREVRLVLGAATDFKRYEDAMAAARSGASDGQVRVLVVPIVRVAR